MQRESCNLSGGKPWKSATPRKRLLFSTRKPLKSRNTDVNRARKRFESYFHSFLQTRQDDAREINPPIAHRPRSYPKDVRQILRMAVLMLCSVSTKTSLLHSP